MTWVVGSKDTLWPFCESDWDFMLKDQLCEQHEGKKGGTAAPVLERPLGGEMCPDDVPDPPVLGDVGGAVCPVVEVDSVGFGI